MDDKKFKTLCIISGGIIACNIVRFINYRRQKKEREELQDLMYRTRNMTNRFIDDMNLSIIEQRKKAYLDRKANENEAN